MYFIKTKGTDKVPDYVQVRDDSFALIEHIKLFYMKKKLKDFFENNIEEKYNKIVDSDFGTVIKIEENE